MDQIDKGFFTGQLSGYRDVQNTHLDPTSERSNTSTNDKQILHRDINDKFVASGFYEFAMCIMLLEQQSN